MPNAVGAVRISGQKGIHSAKMGIYEPQQLEGNTIPWTVNDRVVYRMNGRNRYLFYGASEEWCVGKRENAEKGVAAGWLVVDSQASKPEDITEEWMAFDEAAKRWDQVRTNSMIYIYSMPKVHPQNLNVSHVYCRLLQYR